jgi:hypothetical protein
VTALTCLGKRGGHTRFASGGDANALFRQVDHAGANTDFHTSLALLPDQGPGVVVPANALPAPVSELGQAVLCRLAEAQGLPVLPVLLTLTDILRDQGVEVASSSY